MSEVAQVPKRLVLCGLGPHARRIYYPMLEAMQNERKVELSLLVELETQRPVVEQYLAGRQLQPARVVYLPEKARAGDARLDQLLRELRPSPGAEAWGCIIATEPRAHRAFAHWAILRGWHILLDKPVTAFDLRDAKPASALRLVDEYFALREASQAAGLNVLVQTQRRAHLGYEMIVDYLHEFVAAYEVPITYLDVYHADGMWNMPLEYFSRENHPYKYGYGKLMHSGYHFIDLFVWLCSLNGNLPGMAPDALDILTRHVRPSDHMRQIDLRLYERFFGEQGRVHGRMDSAQLESARTFGETDVVMLCQLLREESPTTTGTLNLLQTSFSRRNWPGLPPDAYKGNGRVRHERVTVQVGHLLSVQVHSYQSYEAKDWTGEGSGTGNYDHFDIEFYRNSGLVGGAPFEHVALGDAMQRTRPGDGKYLGHNEAARGEILNDFLDGRSDRAGLALHETSIKMTAAAYYSMLSANSGQLTQPRVVLGAGSVNWFHDRLRP